MANIITIQKHCYLNAIAGLKDVCIRVYQSIQTLTITLCESDVSVMTFRIKIYKKKLTEKDIAVCTLGS